jgi:hypothetical protein
VTGRAGADYRSTGDDEAPETLEQLIPSAARHLGIGFLVFGGRTAWEIWTGLAMIRSRILANARVMRHRRIPVIQRFRLA